MGCLALLTGIDVVDADAGGDAGGENVKSGPSSCESGTSSGESGTNIDVGGLKTGVTVGGAVEVGDLFALSRFRAAFSLVSAAVISLLLALSCFFFS